MRVSILNHSVMYNNDKDNTAVETAQALNIAPVIIGIVIGVRGL